MKKHYLKLIELARSMKIRVIEKKSQEWAGEWNYNTNTIKVSFGKESWTDKILTLAHELGHAIDDRIRGKDTEAYEHLPENEEEIGYIPKWVRSSIQNREAAANYYKEMVIRFMNIKIPKWKIDLDSAIEQWNYGYILHNSGKCPSTKQINNFKKSWRESKNL